MTFRRQKPTTYREAGVDIGAADAFVRSIGSLARSTARAGADARIGGFGALFDLKAAGYEDPILVASTDGVGTKLKLAIDTCRHDTIGIDLVAMCVNDLVVQGAEPLFFLDYFACGRLDPETARRVVAGIAEGCRLAGCALIGGETAEMPGMYAENDYDLAGFAVGAVARDRLLPRVDVLPGDRLLGLASSGLHSNGFSLVRRLVADSGLSLGDAAPFAPERSLGEVLLEPTRIYVRPLLSVLEAGGAIKAMAHVTGGGITDNLPRVLPDGVSAVVDRGRLPVPAVFGWLANLGNIEEAEMLRTFNCGIGMVVVVAEAEAEAVAAALRRAGEAVHDIGHVATSGSAPVEYVGQFPVGRQ